MNIEKIKITDIIPAEYNPRQISDEELSKLRNSIDEFGLVDPIIINLKNNKIIGGHQRYEVLVNQYNGELNLLRFGDIGWVFLNTDLKIESEEHEKALNLALNKISGDFDNDKLKIVLKDIELSPINISLTGFDDIDLTEMEIQPEPTVEDVIEDNYKPKEDIETDIQHGDIYQLGKHRLMCGDCTQEKDVLLLMDGNKVDMVFTDPPYDLDDNYSNIIFNNSKNNAEIFIMHNERQLAKLIVKYDEYFRRLFAVDFKVAHLINSNAPMTRCDYIAHFRKKGPSTFNNLHDAFSTLIESQKTSKEDENNFNHKHSKNIRLPSEFILHFSNKNENILDLFGGSGSTLIACEQTNRNCYMVEINPYYCQIIINRWEQYTGQKATKIN